MKGKRGRFGIEPLGALLAREQGFAPPQKNSPRAPVSPRDWEAAVGTRIAKRALPVKLDRGILHVRAASSTWAQELSLLSEPILAQLRARGIHVEALRFRVGPVEPPERVVTREEVRTAPPRAKLPKELLDPIALVADEALREAIKVAASINLGWQNMRHEKQTRRTRETNPRAEGATTTSSTTSSTSATKTRDARGLRPAAPESAPPDQAAGSSSAARRRSRGSS